MKIVKELDRDTYKSRFETKLACYQYLADQKWSNGYFCKKNATIVNTPEVSKHVVEGVVNADMMNLPLQIPYFIS
jgi:hypothetical protein